MQLEDANTQRQLEQVVTLAAAAALRAASLGVARGIADGMKPGLLAVSFLAGATLALLAVLVARGGRRRA